MWLALSWDSGLASSQPWAVTWCGSGGAVNKPRQFSRRRHLCHLQWHLHLPHLPPRRQLLSSCRSTHTAIVNTYTVRAMGNLIGVFHQVIDCTCVCVGLVLAQLCVAKRSFALLCSLLSAGLALLSLAAQLSSAELSPVPQTHDQPPRAAAMLCKVVASKYLLNWDCAGRWDHWFTEMRVSPLHDKSICHTRRAKVRGADKLLPGCCL